MKLNPQPSSVKSNIPYLKSQIMLEIVERALTMSFGKFVVAT